MSVNWQSKQLLGYQTISLSNSTAVGLNSTCAKARHVLFSVETNDVRLRLDSTAPTKTTGILYQADATHTLDGYDLTHLKFQRSTGACKVSLAAFKNRNDGDR